MEGRGEVAEGARRGVVHRAASTGVFDMGHVPPGPRAAAFVDHLWWVRWDRTGQEPFRSQTIPFPSVHLTVEGGDPGEVRHGHALPAVLVHGVHSRRWVVELTGAGWVAGAHFRVGGWAAWAGGDAAALTDRVEGAGPPLGGLLDELLTVADPVGRAIRLGEVIDATAPDPTGDYLVVQAADERMRADPSVVRVEQLAGSTGWTTRTLQRRFKHLVGVGPKWVLQRYRLQEAALRLEEDPEVDIASLAVTLGWYDQAHFSNDFRRLLGATPAAYAAAARSPRASAP